MSDSPPLPARIPVTTMPLLLGDDRGCYVIDGKGDPLISTSLSRSVCNRVHRHAACSTEILERWRSSARTGD